MTGVQTCALPISLHAAHQRGEGERALVAVATDENLVTEVRAEQAHGFRLDKERTKPQPTDSGTGEDSRLGKKRRGFGRKVGAKGEGLPKINTKPPNLATQ